MRKTTTRILLMLFAVLISVAFFIRSYFYPKYYVYIMLPEGRWMYDLCGIVSVCFTIMYFVLLVGSRERIGKKDYFFVRLYTIILLVVGFLRNSPYRGYDGLNAIFTRPLYYLTNPPLDFWDYLSSFVPIPFRHISFMCISIGYCLAAGNIIINHVNIKKNKYVNMMFSYSYITYIICNRTDFRNNLQMIQVAMGVIYAFLWIIIIMKMKERENILKKIQIFWLTKLCIVFIVSLGEVPQLITSSRVIALISDFTIFVVFSWPLFLLEQVPYVFRVIIYFSILILMNILCFYLIKQKRSHPCRK